MVNLRHKKRRNFNSNLARYRRPQIFTAKNVEKSKAVFPRWGWKAAMYIILFGITFYFFLFSKFFSIREVIIEGNSLLTKEELIQLVPTGKNIFLFDVKGTKKKLSSDKPEIRSLEIYRGIPNAIKIVVLEREAKIVWQSGENNYLVSDQGEVMKLITGEEGRGLPKVIDKKNFSVSPGKKLVSPNFIAFIVNINQGFFNAVNIKPLDFEVDETTFDVVLRTEAGFYVKLNSLRSSKKQLENLKLVLVNKRPEIKEYVDIRIDGWAYYK